MTHKEERLLKKLCEKLDRQYEQGVQVGTKLGGVYNMLVRIADRMALKMED